MANIKQVLQKSGVPAVRLVWRVRKGEEKPKTYQTCLSCEQPAA